jgi:RluA family pseudouridine synthase
MNEAIKLSSPATHEFWEIPVLYEDAHLLALLKPSGLLSSPDRYDPDRPNLMKLLHEGISKGAPWARARQLAYLANAHRLDLETSGVILLAKDKPSLVALANQFGAEQAEKRYLALVQGAVAESTLAVDAPVGPHPTRPRFMRVDRKHGKRARTLFSVIERFARHTFLECRPLTGRTHQIRVHLRHLGFPIVGDSLYGGQTLLLSSLKPDYRFKPDRQERPLIGRLALHAADLIVHHPVSGERLTIAAPWPKDLVVGLKYLRRYAPAPGSTPPVPQAPADGVSDSSGSSSIS